jgi:hypothetical protein
MAMTSRYVTEKEKDGVRRRQAAYRARKKAAGLQERQITLTDIEERRIREILAVWRGQETSLDDQLIDICRRLQPETAS